MKILNGLQIVGVFNFLDGNQGAGKFLGGDAGGNISWVNALTQDAGDARYLQISNNLSDLNNAATARTNLGLGDMATKTAGTLGTQFRNNDENDARFSMIGHSHTQLHEPVSIGVANGLSLEGQTISLALATTTEAGAMSAADKTKLNGISTGADNYRSWVLSDGESQGADIQSGTEVIFTGTNGVTVARNSNTIVISGAGGSVSGSGTAGRAARWTSSSELGTSAIYDNGTSIAIGGAVNPSHKIFGTQGAGSASIMGYNSYGSTDGLTAVGGETPSAGKGYLGTYRNSIRAGIYGEAGTYGDGSTNYAGYFDGRVHITGVLSIAGGSPGLGKVLTSDANGIGTWESPPGLPTIEQSRYAFCDFHNYAATDLPPFRWSALSVGSKIRVSDTVGKYGIIAIRSSSSYANSGGRISNHSYSGGTRVDSGAFFRAMVMTQEAISSGQVITAKIGWMDSSGHGGAYVELKTNPLYPYMTSITAVSSTGAYMESNFTNASGATWLNIDIERLSSGYRFVVWQDNGTVILDEIFITHYKDTFAHVGAEATYSHAALHTLLLIDYMGFGPGRPPGMAHPGGTIKK